MNTATLMVTDSKKNTLKKAETWQVRTMCMSCPDTAVQVEAPVLQNAVILNWSVFAFVHFMKQSKTVRVFHSQRRQIRVVSRDVNPHMILKHEGYYILQ